MVRREEGHHHRGDAMRTYDVMPPEMPLCRYGGPGGVREQLRNGDTVFFSRNTAGFIRWFTEWSSRGIKALQEPSCSVTHVGGISLLPPELSESAPATVRRYMALTKGAMVRDPAVCRRMLLQATTPCVVATPFSAVLGECQDGKLNDPYDGSIWVARWDDVDGDKAASCAWNSVGLPYAYEQLLDAALDLPAGVLDGPACMRYVCSGYWAECLKTGGAALRPPGDESGITQPVDLLMQAMGWPCPGLTTRNARILWRLR
jgi:hypothetical protein